MRSLIKPPRQQANPSISPKGESTQESNSSNDLSPLSAKSPHPPQNAETTRKRYRHKTPWLKILFDGSALLLGILTFVVLSIYACDTHKIWIETKKSADAAKQAADTAQGQLEMSERPWLDVEVTEVGPLVRTSNGFVISGRLKITNVGHSVAKEVYPNAILIVTGQSDIFYKASREQRRICDVARKQKVLPEFNLGPVLFPGKEYSTGFSGNVSNTEIDSESFRPPKAPAKYILPLVVGCVDYQFTFGGGHHQTGFIYSVARFDKTNPIVPFAIKTVDSLPAKELRFDRWLNGFYAD
jgi:hypothetical protein